MSDKSSTISSTISGTIRVLRSLHALDNPDDIPNETIILGTHIQFNEDYMCGCKGCDMLLLYNNIRTCYVPIHSETPFSCMLIFTHHIKFKR